MGSSECESTDNTDAEQLATVHSEWGRESTCYGKSRSSGCGPSLEELPRSVGNHWRACLHSYQARKSILHYCTFAPTKKCLETETEAQRQHRLREACLMRYAYARYIIIVREYVGASICLPHTCNLCGKSADEFRHHDLSYRSSQGRTSHYHMLNNVIHRSLSSANIPSRLEPSSLYRADGNRPDGVTMVPWSNGRLLVWDSLWLPPSSNRQESRWVSSACKDWESQEGLELP